MLSRGVREASHKRVNLREADLYRLFPAPCSCEQVLVECIVLTAHPNPQVAMVCAIESVTLTYVSLAGFSHRERSFSLSGLNWVAVGGVSTTPSYSPYQGWAAGWMETRSEFGSMRSRP